MQYYIECDCGERVSVNAPGVTEAVAKLVPAVKAHASAKPNHEDFLRDLNTQEEQGLIRSRLMKEP